MPIPGIDYSNIVTSEGKNSLIPIPSVEVQARKSICQKCKVQIR